jgi:hypothetical protein
MLNGAVLKYLDAAAQSGFAKSADQLTWMDQGCGSIMDCGAESGAATFPLCPSFV